jgi:hypothetical protein
VACLNDLLEAHITETVATTHDGEGSPNAAPMGVVRDKDDEDVYARLWEGSTTLENVRATGEVVVNFTRDPVVYVESAMGDGSEFVVEGRLRDADGWVRCNAERVNCERDEVTRWRLVERKRHIERRVLSTHSRGFASIIEATVHATRLGFDPELRDLYEHHVGVAEKCGGEREREAAERLRGYAEE